MSNIPLHDWPLTVGQQVNQRAQISWYLESADWLVQITKMYCSVALQLVFRCLTFFLNMVILCHIRIYGKRKHKLSICILSQCLLFFYSVFAHSAALCWNEQTLHTVVWDYCSTYEQEQCLFGRDTKLLLIILVHNSVMSISNILQAECLGQNFGKMFGPILGQKTKADKAEIFIPIHVLYSLIIVKCIYTKQKKKYVG